MSLKFGIYLVEQRIISPEQFCGLVKIQQEATMSLATIAIRQNFLTIRQVHRVLEISDVKSEQTFLQIAINEDLIDSSDADRMLNHQQSSCPDLRKLVVDCGLLTQRQSEVLYHHYEKQSSIKASSTIAAAAEAAPAHPAEPKRMSPRQPKFTQRPSDVQPYSNQLQ